LIAAPLVEGLARATIVARGPKPVGALARRGLMQVKTVASPFTTAEVLATLATMPVTGREVTVVHYGEHNEPIVTSLRTRGAIVRDLTVYEWQLPTDLAPLTSAIDAIIAGQIPIVALTSQIQLRHLLLVAGTHRQALLNALNTRAVVGAVGPTCAAQCHDAGIENVVVPDQPKLAPLLAAIAAAATRSQADATTQYE
jgi:uroporphyrinogen-III synthase